MAHYHDFNPWADCLIYLPSLEEAALLCCPPPTAPSKLLPIIHRWQERSREESQHPDKLDPYLLRDGPKAKIREMHLGVRWGKSPEEYFSPHIYNEKLALKLWHKYGGPP